MARAATHKKGFLNLKCHEYCGGSEAVCYCPQCSAIFCDSCYDREHEGSERKQRHERLVEVRPICRDHQHTLEYIDLNSLKPICIVCLINLQSRSELYNHDIKNINEVSTKLCSLLNEKIVASKEILRDVQEAAKHTRETTQRTLRMALVEVHDIIKQCKDLLDDREEELLRNIKKIYQDFVTNEESSGLIALANRLNENIEQADRVSGLDDKKFIGAQFPYLFTKLNDLCTTARRRLDSPKELKVTMILSRTSLVRIQGLIDIVTSMVSPTHVDQSHAEGENAELIRGNCVKVMIAPENIPSNHNPAVTSSSTVTTNTTQSVKQSNLHGKQTNQRNKDNELSAVDSKSMAAGFHGNMCKKHECSGNYGNWSPQQENPSIHGDQSETHESPGNDSNWSPKQDNHSNHGSCGIDGNQSEEHESPSILGNEHVIKVVPETSDTSDHLQTNSRSDKGKRGRKRRCKAVPSDDGEWTAKRTLRPSTMEGRTRRTVAPLRSRRGGELSKEMNRCDAILTILLADKDSWPFVHLVDKKRCPEYYDKISNPLSLDIIKQNLHSYQYRSVLDFVRDVNQIIENCNLFNKPDTDVHQAGTRLALRFNNLLKECFPNFESVFQDQELMNSSL